MRSLLTRLARCNFSERDLASDTRVGQGRRPPAGGLPGGRGSLAFRDGDSAQSVQRFEEALRLEPQSMERRFSLAQAQLGASDEAIRSRAVRRSKTWRRTWV
jgi:Flp pilus assembly protein TadD